MKKWSLKTKLFRVLFSVVLCFSCAFGVFGVSSINVNAITKTDTSSYVSVGELWNSSSKTFNTDNVNILYKYITGIRDASIGDIKTLLSSCTDTLYNEQYSAESIRANTISAGTHGATSYSAKTSGKDIVVTLGGLKWQVVYLSNDKSDNPTLTLWLANSYQDAWTSRSKTEGAVYGFVSGSLFSEMTWEYQTGNHKVANSNTEITTTLYGLSYMRGIVLNNGGTYASASNTIVQNQAQSSSSAFAMFTMDEYGLTNYITKPSQVGWQEYQSAKTVAGTSYSYSNDAWGSGIKTGYSDPYGNTYSFESSTSYGENNYSDASANPKTYNANWNNDHLWLPSLAEIGSGTGSNGLWKVNQNQRKNYTGSDSDLGGLGSAGSAKTSWPRTFTRSGNNTGLKFHTVSAGGSTTSVENAYTASAVRPCIHLNLSAIDNAMKAVTVGELWDDDTDSMNTENVDILVKYLTGKSNGSLSDIDLLASSTTDAADFRTRVVNSGLSGSSSYAQKYSGQDIIVRLGGIDWYATYLSMDTDGNSILTLWMTNSTQSAFSGGSNSAGTHYGYLNGTLYSDWSSNYYDGSLFTDSFPASLYGSSYIRAVTLNNGGTYGTSRSASSTFTKSSSSLFAKFTMPDNSANDITDYIVTPSKMLWQQYQSAITTIGSGVFSNTLPNEAWGNVPSSGTDAYGNTYNFYSNSNFAVQSAKAYNDVWKNDYLWLPSLTETGNSTTVSGLWSLSKGQRANYDGVTSAKIGNVGSNAGEAFARTWLRSGYYNHARSAYYITVSGDSTRGVDTCRTSYGVRPALHLNLSKIASSMPNVVVDELWDGTNNEFNDDNVKVLMSYLTGKTNASFLDIDSQISFNSSTGVSSAITAEGIRNITVSGGIEGLQTYTPKYSGQNVLVRLGGLDWYVTYLSKDIDGNPIATLMLSNSTQEAFYDVSQTKGTYYGALDGTLYSSFNGREFGYSTSQTVSIPTNMYGTSYVRSVTLNNGGQYYKSTSTLNADPGKDSSNPFALFTMTDLTQYITQPKDVLWQKYQSGYYYLVDAAPSDYANDSWGQITQNYVDPYGHTHYFRNTNGNYSSKTNFDAWKNDYLWIPSVTEYGLMDSPEGIGMWELGAELRANMDGVRNTNAIGYVGSGNVTSTADEHSARKNTMLRSNKYDVGNLMYFIHVDGNATMTSLSFNNWYAYSSYAVRPCLHLNLKTISDSLDYVEVGEIWDEDNAEFDEDNVNLLFRYLTGNSGADINTINGLGANDARYTAANIRSKTLASGTIGSNNYIGKTSSQNVVVTLGGLKWYATYLSQNKQGEPILTLWLNNSTQDAFYGRSATEGEYYGFLDGGLYSTYSYDVTNRYFTETYPSSMYGLSYMRAVTLNGGGTYATSPTTVNNAIQNTSSVFAKFTIADEDNIDLTDFITKPIDVGWQEYQSAITSSGYTYSQPNDAWSSDIKNGFSDPYGNTYNFYTSSTYGNSNYAEQNAKAYNDAWNEDYLWLPSLTETGYSDSNLGLWRLSVGQRKTYDGVSTLNVGQVGSRKIYAYPRTRLRSGTSDNGYHVWVFYAAGWSENDNGGSTPFAVRPALHLNLYNVIYGSGGKDISENGRIEIDETSSMYDGNEKTPTVKVYYNEVEMIINEEYILELRKDGITIVDEIRDAGFYVYTARGIGTYEGTLDVRYTVVQIDISTASISPVSDQEYTGRLIEPEITVSFNVALTEGVDYTIVYKNNLNVGTATIEVKGIGNYRGTAKTTFRILGKDINVATIDYVADKISPGQDIAIQLSYQGKKLMQGIDYTLSYSPNNVDYGPCTVTITGINAWTGSRTVTATVGQMSILDDVAVIFSFMDVVFSENPQQPTVVLKHYDRNLILNTDYQVYFYRDSIQTSDFTNSGTITIRVIGINDWKDEYTNSYTIHNKNVNSLSLLGLTDYEWTGEEITPNLVLLNNGVELDKNSSYDYTISDNRDIGKATITITGKGNYEGTRVVTFDIIKARPKVSIGYENKEYFEGQSVPKLNILSANIDGKLEVLDDTLVYGENAYRWRFIPVDNEHYNILNGVVNIDVIKDYVVDTKVIGTYKTKYDEYSIFDCSGIGAEVTFASGKKLTLDATELNFSHSGVLEAGDTISMTLAGYPDITIDLDIDVVPLPENSRTNMVDSSENIGTNSSIKLLQLLLVMLIVPMGISLIKNTYEDKLNKKFIRLKDID